MAKQSLHSTPLIVAAEDIVPAAYELVVESTSDGVVLLDAQNRILKLNPAAQSMIGDPAAKAIGQSVEQIWPEWPDEIEWSSKAVRKELGLNKGVEPHTYDVRILSLADTSGHFTIRVAILRDITERKRMGEHVHRMGDEARRRVREQMALREVMAVIASTLNLSDVLGRIAEQMCQIVDVTSASVCSWESVTKTSTMLAEYYNPNACAQEQTLGVGSSRVIENSKFMRTLLAGQSWTDFIDTPDLSESNRNHMLQYGAQAILYVPLYVRGQLIGFAELRESRRSKRFTPEETSLCWAIAQEATVAIENARLHEQVQQELVERKQAEESLRTLNEELENQVSQRTAELTKTNVQLVREIDERKEAEARLLERNRELLSLHSAAAATNASLDLEFVLETVSWEMTNLLQIERCVIYERNEGANVVSVIAEYSAIDDKGKAMRGQTCDLAHYPLRERVMAERSTRQITISQPDVDLAELGRMHEIGIKTLLIVPMVFQDRVVGLVEMWDSQVERTFTDREISVVQFLTTQAASAVENARLYERAQREIKERIRAEEQIKASLKEKEVLLKEIHHRVKNNLQVISSMLRLQARNVDDQLTLQVLEESQNRIRSMALIHERLYRSQDLAKVDFGVYIRDLAIHLVHSYKTYSGGVDLDVNVEDIFLDIDTAIPCGLIANELICNSMKYAFPSNDRGKINVDVYVNQEQLTMIISDDGVGIPPDLDYRNTGSLGLQLVNALVDQLEGSIELYNNEGTEFKITFAMP
ncbi:MAG: GAF domain-containing protein [Chloroflexi bacterium]|nr:GAF domain-containing protein [Chloroflexota bacterium]